MPLPSRFFVRTVAFRRAANRVVGYLPAASALLASPSRSGITKRALHSVWQVPPASSPEVLSQASPTKETASVSTKALLNGLRDLQSLNNLIPDIAGKYPPNYKAALRVVSLLAGYDGGRSKPLVSLAELEQVVPQEEHHVVWRVVGSLLANEPLPELAMLDDKLRAMVLFNRIHGFGKMRAEDFANIGIRTLDDLAATKEGKWKISGAQMLAIKYHEDMDNMVPRSEVDEFNALIKRALVNADPTFDFAIMGSYRRGEEISSDVDVVICHPSFTKRDEADLLGKKRKTPLEKHGLMATVLTAFEDAGLLEESKIFSKGDKKVLALTRLPTPNSIHRQIDIRLCPLESLPYMLLGNTGDDMLMKKLRWRAARKGLVLNEYGMGMRKQGLKTAVIEKGTEIIVQSEQEIFGLLGLPYLEPHERGAATYTDILAGH